MHEKMDIKRNSEKLIHKICIKWNQTEIPKNKILKNACEIVFERNFEKFKYEKLHITNKFRLEILLTKFIFLGNRLFPKK